MAQPVALEHARTDLEARIRRAIKDHATGAPLALDLSIEHEGHDGAGPLSDAPPSISTVVRELVASFHGNVVVRGAGLRARHVTAFDSDGDGEATVSVRFVYDQESTSTNPSDRAA